MVALKTNTPGVFIPSGLKPYPKPHEIAAAQILATYFKRNAVFLPVSPISSADLRIGNIVWEIKSPIGNGKHNISKTMREAEHQSPNVVVDLRRSRLSDQQAISRIRNYLKTPNHLKRVLVISKTARIVAIKAK